MFTMNFEEIKKKAIVKILFITIFILMMFCLPLTADEVYIWKDKNGVENITSTPPPENAKVIHREKYQQHKRSEIEAYQRQQKAEAERRNREDRVRKSISTYKQKIEDINQNYEEDKRKREIERAKDAYEREQERLERYQDYRRNALTRYGRDLWNDSINKQEKEVDEARKKLYELERNP